MEEIEKEYLIIAERIRKRPNTTSKYIGVWKIKGQEKWAVKIKIVGFPIFRARFDSEEKAAQAYDSEIIKRKGNKAKTNFPIDNYLNNIT